MNESFALESASSPRTHIPPAEPPPQDWEIIEAQGTTFHVRTDGRGACALLAQPRVVCHPDGRPQFSATFVGSDPRAGASERPLLELVEHASVGVELTLEPSSAQLAALTAQLGPVRLATAEQMTLKLLHHSQQVAHAQSSTLSAALATTLPAEPAAALLELLAGGQSDFWVEWRYQLRAPYAPGNDRTLQGDLAEISQFLASIAQPPATLTRTQLSMALRDLLLHHVIKISGGSPTDAMPDPEGAVTAWLRAAAPIFEAVDSTSAQEPHYRIRPWTGSMIVTFRASAAAPVAPVDNRCIALADLLRATGADLMDEAFTQFLVHDGGGRLAPLPKQQRGRAARSTDNRLIALPNQRLVSLASATGAAARPAMLASDKLAVHQLALLPSSVQGLTYHATIAINPSGSAQRSLPVIDDSDSPLWPDRRDAKKRWYLPVFHFVAQTEDPAGFAFEFQVKGHDLSGRPGLEATVRLRLTRAANAATAAAMDELEAIDAQPVPFTSLAAVLEIPFRDEHGVTQVESINARSVQLDQAGVTAEFALRDQWARAAYGVFAYEDFQARPARLRLTYGYEAYRKKPTLTPLILAYGGKFVGVRRDAAQLEKSRDPRQAAQLRLRDGSGVNVAPSPTRAKPQPAAFLQLNVSHALAAQAVNIRPTVELTPTIAQTVQKVQYVETQASRTATLDVFFACGQFGRAYRQQRADGSVVEIGCQSALQLGELRHRIYEHVSLPEELAPFGVVLRVLSSPGRFALVPNAYIITRFSANDNAGPLKPALLLFSTVDIQDLRKSRCVITCGLAGSVSAAQAALLLDYLRRHHDPAAVLEPIVNFAHETEVSWSLPSEGGGVLELQIEHSEVPTGFEVSLSTDAFGLPQLEAILQTAGVRGSAALRLSDGTEVRALLDLNLARIGGPYPSGPVVAVPSGEAIKLTNMIDTPVLVDRLLTMSGGLITRDEPAGLRLEAGASQEFPTTSSAAELVVDARADSSAAIPEIRSFAEDIEVGLSLFNSLDLAALAIERVSVRVAIVGAPDAREVHFGPDSSQQVATLEFLLPLTVFLTDPKAELQFTVRRDGVDQQLEPKQWSFSADGYLVLLTAELLAIT